MYKSVFLYVSGDDYSAINFEEKYNPQKVYKEMIYEGIIKKTIENDEHYIEVEIKEFNEVDPNFVTFILDSLCDYDQLKGSNIYRVNYYDI